MRAARKRPETEVSGRARPPGRALPADSTGPGLSGAGAAARRARGPRCDPRVAGRVKTIIIRGGGMGWVQRGHLEGRGLNPRAGASGWGRVLAPRLGPLQSKD